MLRLVASLRGPPVSATPASKLDVGLVVGSLVLFGATSVASLLQLGGVAVFPTVLRWWPGALALAALVYAASFFWFLGRFLFQGVPTTTSGMTPTQTGFLCMAVAKLVHASVFTISTVVFMVQLPLSEATAWFRDGQVLTHAPQGSGLAQGDLDNADATLKAVWALVAIQGVLGFVATLGFVRVASLAWPKGVTAWG